MARGSFRPGARAVAKGCAGALLGALLGTLIQGCSTINGDLFPNAPNHSFINTPALGQGAPVPTQPVSGHTTANPTGK